MTTYTDLPLGAIEPSDGNPRRTFDEGALAELAESIRSVGLLEPLIVRARARRERQSKARGGAVESCRYELICGERRWRAASIAGLEEVPCRVIVATDEQALELALVENSQRVDVDPFEESQAIGRLVAYGRDVAEVGARLGRSARWVQRRLALRLVPDEIVAMVRAGRMPLGGAEIIAALDPARRSEIVAGIRTEEHVSIQTVRRYCATRPLKSATWDLSDPGMAGDVGHAGPCSTCPRRSTAQIDLWGSSVQGEGDCLSPSCYDARASLVIARREKWASEHDVPVIEQKAWCYGAPAGFAILDGQVDADVAVRLGVRTVEDLDVEWDDLPPKVREAPDALHGYGLRDGREVTWRDVLSHLGVGHGVDAILKEPAHYGRQQTVSDLVSRERLAGILEEAGETKMAERYRPVDVADRKEERKKAAAAEKERLERARAQILIAWDAAPEERRIALVARALGASPEDWSGVREWAAKRWDVAGTVEALAEPEATEPEEATS